MHQALKLDEVLRNIFANLGVQDDSKVGNSSQANGVGGLLSLALTCSTFQEPSLDVLWMDLDTLDPLMHLFPEDAISRADGQWILERDLHNSDWRRVTLYSHRVRHLAIDCYSDSYDPNSDREGADRSSTFGRTLFAKLHHFTRVLDTQPLLPNLKTFSVILAEFSDLPCIELFATASLKVLTIRTAGLMNNCEEHDNASGGDTENLPRWAAARLLIDPSRMIASAGMVSLQKLVFPIRLQSPPQLLEAVEKSYVQMLQSLPNLQSLSISGELLSLGNVGTCVGHTLELKELDVRGLICASFGSGAFSSLRTLHTTIINLPCILASLAEGSLITRVCWSRWQGVKHPRDCREAVETLSRKCPLLQHLTIKSTANGSALAKSGEAPWGPKSLLSPLSRCRYLSFLLLEFDEFSAWSLINLRADEYMTLYQQLPHLTHLELLTYVRAVALEARGLCPRASLQDAIEPLAKYCRVIETVVLGFALLWDLERIGPKSKFSSSLAVLDIRRMYLMLKDESRIPVDTLVRRAEQQAQGYLTTLTGNHQDHLELSRQHPRLKEAIGPDHAWCSLLVPPPQHHERNCKLIACHFTNEVSVRPKPHTN